LKVRIGDNWKCPYCGLSQVLDNSRVEQYWRHQDVSGWINEGESKKQKVPSVFTRSIVCANDDCRELTLLVAFGTAVSFDAGRERKVYGPEKTWTLLPPSSAKPQPDYIPPPIRDDYYEACAIRDLSPKASATITRRCLQGMIRDFCGISKYRLIDEIEELRQRAESGNGPTGVQLDTVIAIDDVRQIGNIGAHMEADINVIVDVDPDEAQILIELVEALFLEWYVARDARTQRLGKLKSIAADKKSQKQAIPISSDKDE
jgi:hypothetical protein